MAAGRNIKGITIEIGGDTTGLQKALSDVNGKLKSTQAQLKDVNNLLKLDPSNTVLVAQKQELLKNAIAGHHRETGQPGGCTERRYSRPGGRGRSARSSIWLSSGKWKRPGRH